MTGAREESDPKWVAWNGTCGRAGGDHRDCCSRIHLFVFLLKKKHIYFLDEP